MERDTLILLLAAGVLMMVYSPKVSEIRGIRNHNPGNIERNGIVWDGMSADQSSDDRFVVFESPEWGIRAMAKILTSYRQRGVVTLSAIINTWAPPFENNTAAYVNHVTQLTGIDANEPVSESDYGHVISAIIAHENGINPYSMTLINRGVEMAA